MKNNMRCLPTEKPSCAVCGYYNSSGATCHQSLPPQQAARIFTALRALATNPRPVGCVKLADGEEWRIRVGAYRVIYEIDDKALIVTIIRAGHRRDVYR